MTDIPAADVQATTSDDFERRVNRRLAEKLATTSDDVYRAQSARIYQASRALRVDAIDQDDFDETLQDALEVLREGVRAVERARIVAWLGARADDFIAVDDEWLAGFLRGYAKRIERGDI